MKAKWLLLLSGLCLLTSLHSFSRNGDIVLHDGSSALVKYSALELQRYLYLACGEKLEIRTGTKSIKPGSFILGQTSDNMQINDQPDGQPGPQGYSLRKIDDNIFITGADPEGVLYGVYGLLEDYYGIGFYLGGDVLPEKIQPLIPVTLNEQKTPRAAIRGFLPWTNFPQSAGSYSWADWTFIIDQAAKMRMNFIHIHNYTGEFGYPENAPRCANEMFHNFTLNGFTSRVWMPTSKTGHIWKMPGWDVDQYRFGAGDLFDDDFGADYALHNESLDNEQVFRKGVAMFQKIIDYAHSRGVKIGLGIDIDLIPPGYGAKSGDPEVLRARAMQIATDYPDLDYLLCFQSENVKLPGTNTFGKNAEFNAYWQKIFMGFYDILKEKAPHIRMAVSGWGIAPEAVKPLPADVICAPIAAYTDGCEPGSVFGNREYWGCPWLERDGSSSEYYYPYNIHLSNTIKAWQNRSPNMKGFYSLTWRLTDAIDPKMSFMSKAAWDDEGRYTTSEALYSGYALLNYGSSAVQAITGIINQNEPFASGFGECEPTPPFRAPKDSGSGIGGEYARAAAQLEVIDRCIASANPTCRARLQLLRCRIAAAKDHIELNYRFRDPNWTELPDVMQSWVRNFTHRVTDISSLGNVVSVENRFVQQNYLPREQGLRTPAPVKAPLFPVVVSPPVSVAEGDKASIKVRVLDSRSYDQVSATLYWRVTGKKQWNKFAMTRIAKAIFVGVMPSGGLVEYHLIVSEGDAAVRWPPEQNLTFITQ